MLINKGQEVIKAAHAFYWKGKHEASKQEYVIGILIPTSLQRNLVEVI